MRNISLKDYIAQYDTGDKIFEVIEENHEFFDNYIRFGDEPDHSDTYLSAKAIEKLNETFEKKKKAPKAEVKPEVKSETTPKATSLTRPRKKKVETQKSLFDTSPITAEDCKIDEIRQVLVKKKAIKLENMALMSDEKLIGYLNDNYYLINSGDSKFFISKKALNSLKNEIISI